MNAVIVTASYRGDFERCRLLCESIDAHVSGHSRHLLLVEPRDVALFRTLEGPRRQVVDERELFPWWLRSVPDPTSFGRRRVWLSLKGPPLRGWHAQQLRRIEIGRRLEETVMISVDSDVVFLRPFETERFVEADGRIRLFRRPDWFAGIAEPSRSEHRGWSGKAGELLGIETPAVSDHGYISTLIAWRTDSVRAMAARIEAMTGKPAFDALAATRQLSECTIYGRFVEEIEGLDLHHVASPEALCSVYWSGAALDGETLSRFVEALEPQQVAIGIQSFTGTSTQLIRRVAGLG